MLCFVCIVISVRGCITVLFVCLFFSKHQCSKEEGSNMGHVENTGAAVVIRG